MRRRSHDEQRSWRYLDIINRMIDPAVVPIG
jgi:putative ATP-dependent endonuclease of OLD family